ncbi:unnamed protein product [Nyctereutes procyonoides]|uniref:(raccoon dog) hypothetical protein n=1 Tax=Nyctereutes procyonoides TaxID=34880 RepID=A0A811YEN7_NYCPR|nr:unnamed protein product [Nyctereutes procyonoides]
MSEPQECSSRESASGRRTRAGATCGQSRARFLRAAPPGQPARDGASPAPAARPGRPEARAQGGQGGLGAQGSPNCSKWQQREPAVPLTYPARLGQLAAGARALGRHKGTMEKLFSARADGGAQGPRLGASAQRGSAARRGQAAAPGSRPPPLPRREPFPRVSKKCQVLRGPHPAREPSPPPPLLPRLPASPAAALPGRPSASCTGAMTQGNAAGWQSVPGPAGRLGAPPPPPRPPPPAPAPAPAPAAAAAAAAASAPAARPSGEPPPGAPRGAGGGGRGGGAGRGARGARALGLLRPRAPRDRRPPPAARLGPELCSFPSNYLSEPRRRAPRAGPCLPEGLPAGVRGALGARGAQRAPPASRPPASRPRAPRPRALLSSPCPLLFCCLCSRTRPGQGYFSPPPPAREFAVWTHSQRGATWDRICT